MAGPGAAALSPTTPSLPARLGRWLLRRRRPQQGAAADGLALDPLLLAGQRLRQRREELGLNLRQLALQTRISTPVLEALERGWRDRLPEAAYLRTMLPLLERQLQLPPGCLDPALPDADPLQPLAQRRRGLLRRFTPGSIEVFSSWQGTVLYGLLVLGLIYALNLEQRRLAAAGRHSLRPIPPLPASTQPVNTSPAGSQLGHAQPASPQALIAEAPRQALLQALPELRPLEQAGQGVALRRLQAGSPAAAPQPGPPAAAPGARSDPRP